MGKRKKRLANADISAFCEQLALVMKAGISMQEGLLLLLEDAQDAAGAETIRAMADEMERGGSFAQALRAAGVFPGYMIHMAEIGEASGRLDDVLQSLSEYYVRSDALTRGIRSAVAYPMVMVVMMFAVIIILIVEVMPVFQNVFHQLGSEMSAFAQGILGIGNAISRYSAVILGVLAAAILVFLLLRLTPKGRAVLASLYAFFFRSLSQTIASGRFASAMSLMLESGMDVDSALDMTLELVEDARTREKIRRIQDYMHGGARFSDAVVSAEMFSGVNAHMLTVGFRTGALDTVMRSIARSYDEQVERKISGILSVLEPVLVAVLSLIVGMILLSVMLPLMGIMSAIG